MKNIIYNLSHNLLKKLNKRNAEAGLVIALAVLVVTSAFIGIARAQALNETHQSNIAFDQNQAMPIVITQKTTVIQPGLAKADIDRLNNEADPEIIKAFMQGVAAEYGVDWKLVYAIGYHESGNFSSALARSNNNYFGRKASGGGYASWATPEEGIRNQFVYLKTRYFDRGMDTPAKINHIYAEDMSWHYKVESVMASL